MAMDNELRKILLREQDLRFVTDALGQYLGKKSEERKYYADQSQKERMAIEEARIKAASATEDIPEMEKFHYNIAEQDEWSEPFKAFVKDRGLNITGGEKGKLFDLTRSQDPKVSGAAVELHNQLKLLLDPSNGFLNGSSELLAKVNILNKQVDGMENVTMLGFVK